MNLPWCNPCIRTFWDNTLNHRYNDLIWMCIQRVSIRIGIKTISVDAKANYSEILVWCLIVRCIVFVVPIVLYINRVLCFLQLETTIIDYHLFGVTGKLEESQKKLCNARPISGNLITIEIHANLCINTRLCSDLIIRFAASVVYIFFCWYW